MNWLFYALDCPKNTVHVALDSRLSWEVWRPTGLQVRPRNLPLWPFGIWWLLHGLRIFKNREYCLVLIRDGGRVIHRSCIFPGYFRFPFMAPKDLQIGDTWTAPTHRGRGLATCGLQRAVEIAGGIRRRLWYLVEESNAPSIRVVEKAGFVCVARGERTQRFGLGLLGSFRFGAGPLETGSSSGG